MDKISVENYLDGLQEFLEAKYGDDICSDFFLSEHHEGGVIANIIIGAEFEKDHIKQINVILVPEVDMDDDDTVTEDPFEAARTVL